MQVLTEVALALNVQNIDMTQKTPDPEFAQELLRYKILLKEIREALGVKARFLAAQAGLERGSYYFYEYLPHIGDDPSYKTLPVAETHQVILRIFKERDISQEWAAKIEEFDQLYQQYVPTEQQRRKDSRVDEARAAMEELSHERAAKTIAELECKTALTKYLRAKMQASAFVMNDFNIHSGNRNEISHLFEILDSPDSEKRPDYRQPREKLDKILSFAEFDFTSVEKEIAEQLFHVNCWQSVFKDDALAEKNPVQRYKSLLRVLMFQSGSKLEDIGEMLGGVTWECARQLVSPDADFQSRFPSLKQHKKLCANLKKKCQENEISLNMDDLKDFSKFYATACSEKQRLDKPKGRPANTKKMTALGRGIAEILESNRLTVEDVAANLGVKSTIVRYSLSAKGAALPLRIAEILRQKSSSPGSETAGKSFIIGFSGLSFEEDGELEKLVKADSLRR